MISSYTKFVTSSQYTVIANSNLGIQLYKKPLEGWVRTIRIALRMSCSQLGERMGMSRNRISVLERKEAQGDITLNQLEALAEQLNCDFRYALVPRKSIDDIVNDRATEIASMLIHSNSQNMFLEGQTNDEEAKNRLFKKIKAQVIESGGRVLWSN